MTSCSCADGTTGTQSCVNGSFGDCQCGGVASTCGDSKCTGTETCLSCHDDCGDCPQCNAAPSCTDAVGVPANPSHRVDLDKGIMSTVDGGGAPDVDDHNCKEPQLRIRAASIKASKDSGALYCIITASDGTNSEVAITTKTKDLKDGETNYFDPTVGVFWGQKALVKTSTNLTITYDCWHVGSDAWSKALSALSSGAMMAGGIAGPYGWAFGAAGAAAAAAASAAASTSGDDHLFNMQQTIDRKTLIDLTNGRTWDIHESGSCGTFCTFDWTLTVESWGCADVKLSPG